MRTTTYRRALLGALGCLLAGLLIGCSSQGPEVTGKVTFNGQPLTTGVVIYHPDASKGNQSKHQARGRIDEQGNYTLTCDSRECGIAAGWYRVSVISTRKDPRNEYAVPTSIIPRRYGDPRASGQSREVREHAPQGAYDLTLNP